MGYLTFKSDDGEFTLKVFRAKKIWDGTLEYSTDASTWTTWSGTTTLSSVNNVLYLRGIGNTTMHNICDTYGLSLTGTNIQCIGNIEYLLDYATVDNNEHPTMDFGCYERLFQGCTSLTTAPELPATTLAASCYYGMFQGCTSLTTAPELPATTLAASCYHGMFQGCTSLTTAPELPATTLAASCYYEMFDGCTSLKVSSIKTDVCWKEWRIPSSGTISTTSANWNRSMLSNTGGTYTSNPLINTTYFIAEPRIKRGSIKLSEIDTIYPRTSADMVEGLEDYVHSQVTAFTETDPTVPEWAKQSTKPAYTAEEVGAMPIDAIILPEVTASDSGKFLRVSASGTWIAASVPIAEEAEF